jgi:predicted 3-demethylubiquinone-9 3-methyltransferase (glyoxalase superfamily)
MQKIVTFLWYNGQAEEAANFYVGIFENSKITDKVINTIDTPSGPTGSVLTVGFNLDGQQFTAINGGPQFAFTEAISLVVNCDTQKELDRYWQKLTEGGEESVCGWLKDKYGLSWQVVPSVLPRLLHSGEDGKSARVMTALMKMKKLDIAVLEQA